MPREAIHSTLNLEDRVRTWPEIKHYALAISTLTLQFDSLPPNNINEQALASLAENLKDLANLTTLNINSKYLKEGNLLVSLLTTIAIHKFSNLQSLTIASYNLTILPTELTQLQCLHNLTIYAPYLTTLPTALGRLQNLQHLSITINESCVIPSEIDQLEKRGVSVMKTTVF